MKKIWLIIFLVSLLGGLVTSCGTVTVGKEPNCPHVGMVC